MATSIDPEIKPFASAKVWETWLSSNLGVTQGIWIQIAKKATGIATVTHDEALDVALCYGWIDGQRKSLDESYFLQKFTPRRARSLWSKRNITKVTALTESGRMQPGGYAEIDAAQEDGRWEAAYDAQKDMTIPDDFLAALEQNSAAKQHFSTLNKSSLFMIGWRLQTARTPETRARRMQVLITTLEKGQNL